MVYQLKQYITNPTEIEKKSFKIISNELGEFLPKDNTKNIIIRVIHTTADFEYQKILEFVNKPIEAFNNLIKDGVNIYTDTQMISSGVNKTVLKNTDSHIYNFTHDEDVIDVAKAKNVTRAIIGINKALKQGNIDIFAIGNSPTALNHLIERTLDESIKIPLIIGCPVGFVGAEESKKNLDSLSNIPFIRTNGRKGGSTVVTAIINALLYQSEKNE